MMTLPKEMGALSVGRSLRFLAAGGGAFLLSACASLPVPAVGDGPKDVASLGAASLQGEGGEWPAQNWWRGYGDAQLSALIEQALVDAPDMRVAAARARQAAAMAAAQKGDLLPQLGAGAGVTAQKQSYTMGFPSPRGWDDNGRASLDLSWDLDFWGRNRAAYAAALSAARAAEAERAQAALLLSTAIASDYAMLTALHADRDAAADAVKVRAHTLRLMKERQHSGLEHQGAVEQAASAKAQAEGEVTALDEALEAQRFRLAALTGQGPDAAANMAKPVAAGRGQARLPNNLPAALLGRRPDIIAARERIEAAAKRIDVAERSFYPNVNLSAFVGLSSLNLSSFFKADSMIGGAGPAISLPIFQGGKLRANYRLSEADFDAAVAQYDGAVAHALGEVAISVNAIKRLEQRIAHAREAERAAEAAWTIAGNRYRGGLARYLDVLAAEDALIGTRRALTALETRALALDIDLIRALGGAASDI